MKQYRSTYASQFKLGLIFLVFIAVFAGFKECHGQTEYKEFKVIDRELVFQLIVDDSISADKAVLALKNISNVSNVDNSNKDVIYAEFRDYQVDYKKQGRKWGNTPVVFNNSRVNGKVKMEFKDGKYRLTLYALEEVTFEPYRLTQSFFISYCRGKDGTLKRGEVILDILNIYSTAFKDTFSMEKMVETKGDW